tara:strand:- start:318 stop:1031 length:714 start_codon:yes stop_codon:yes gene_type:complete
MVCARGATLHYDIVIDIYSWGYRPVQTGENDVNRRAKRRQNKGIKIALSILLVIVFLWMVGLYHFAALIPEAGPISTENTDAIVVLTGGARRVSEGLSLLERGLGKRLFVSGVYRGVDVQALLKIARRAPGEFECCIALGYLADSTRGNAVETSIWIEREKISSIRIVTASYHMPRSLLEFRHALPRGVRIVTHPVFPVGFRQDNWWRWRGSARLAISEYHKYLFAILEIKFFGKGN